MNEKPCDDERKKLFQREMTLDKVSVANCVTRLCPGEGEGTIFCVFVVVMWYRSMWHGWCNTELCVWYSLWQSKVSVWSGRLLARG